MDNQKDWTKERLEKEYISKMKAVTIATDISLQGKQRILDQSEMEKILRNAVSIVQQECGCRKEFGKCIDPMYGCLTIDEDVDDGVKRGGREVTVSEALASLKETYDAGLVHMAYIHYDDDKIHHICSCCTCCCHSLAAAVRFGYSDHVFYSSKIAKQDEELCTNCGTCVDRCHFHARNLVDDKLDFKEEMCGGCGVCLLTCPEEAIEMIDRD
jgi:Pyruvate/2-oxoacid:ferredoxin oxidoreductase delta subunit